MTRPSRSSARDSPRPARRVRSAPGERIHVLGIAGAGASAAALHARGRGRHRHRLRSGRSVAVHAGARGRSASRSPGRTTRRTSPTGRDRTASPSPRRSRRSRPDHPELRAAAARGIPAEPWQQVVADAAHGRDARRRRRHARQEHDRGLADLDPRRGRARPVRLRRRAAPGRAHRAGSRRRPGWGRGRRSSSRPTSTPATSTPIVPDVVALTTVEWDHPDVFDDRAAVIRAFARLARPGPECDGDREPPGRRASSSCSAGCRRRRPGPARSSGSRWSG